MALRFYLNDELVELENVRADTRLLDYLREEARLKGSKEGCAEGDCGACTVLLGRLEGGALRYRSMNACIAFMPMLHGAHIVTIEALAKGGDLHWVQEAMIAHHGSQCGFCTPGIVMSLYAAWMNADGAMGYRDWQVALQGNLCRCTGYAPILRAMLDAGPQHLALDDVLMAHRADMAAKLTALPKDMLSVAGDGGFYVPTNLAELEAVYAMNPEAVLVSGATDVGLWVSKRFRNISPAIFLHDVDELYVMEDEGEALRLGAMVSYAQSEAFLKAHIAGFGEFFSRIAGPQVRNMGTLGGNIANGSPIGDTPPMWIALGARIVLNRGGERRELPIEDYFVDYGKQDRAPGEFLEAIVVPKSAGRLVLEKVSKRKDEDISAVMMALYYELEGDKVSALRLAYGGMAAIPKRAREAEGALLGAAWSEENVRKAMKGLEKDFAPISDMRASKEYRMKLAQNLLLKAFHESEMAQAAE